MRQNTQDLTRGPLGRQILFFSAPLIVSNLLQVLFNVADIAVVGRFAGSLALGSVGSTTILVTMFTSFLIGLASGINVLVALYFGAKDEKAVGETVHSAFLISVIVGALLFIIGFCGARTVLTVMHTKAELIDGAVLYIRIYFLGMPALAVYNFGNAVYSAVGNTKKPLCYLSMAGVINIILNLFFVIVCGLGVAGVALASIISQYLSAAMVTISLFRSRGSYGLVVGRLRLEKGKAAHILKIGLPAALQNAIFQIANLFVQTGVNSFDAVMVAGNSAAVNADALIFDVMTAFYTACGSFMGQNLGAGNKKRLRNSYLISLAYSFGVGTLMGVSLVIFGRSFLGLFTTDPAVIEAGMTRLSIMGMCYGVSAFMDCTIAASRALGKGVIPTIMVLMGSCVFRVIWIYTIFAWFHTIFSLYLLYIFSWTLTAAAEIIYFIRVYKNTTRDLA